MLDDKRLGLSVLGIFIGLIGLLFPTFTPQWSSWIYENIELSIHSNDSGKLMMTALSYVAWYGCAFLLIYLGSMITAHVIAQSRSSLFYQCLFVLFVLGSLFALNHMYHEHYSYLIHVIVLGILLFLQNFIPQQKYFYFIFMLILTFLLVSVQWLNLIPGVTDLGFGRDDFAVSIKLADEYLTVNKLFNTLATIFFVVFFVIGVIVAVLLHLYSKQMVATKKLQIQTEELKATRGALIETNVYKEINSLVHDLKSPLVTVDGLISLLSMKIKDDKTQGYFKRITGSLQKMNDMVSEILHEDTKRKLEVKELIDYVVSHLAIDDPKIELKVVLEEDLPPIKVNKIRMARAISNIIENALLSLKEQGGVVEINCQRSEEGVQFTFLDDGPGVDPKYIQHIWEEGFSTKDSSGIGLPFVKRVVQNHNGIVKMESEPDVYTRVDMYIPIQ